MNDDPTVEAAVHASCPAPHVVEVFSRNGLVDAQQTLSVHGQHIVEAVTGADAVLITWSFEEAPALNTLCFHIRRALLAPVLMLCPGTPDAFAAAIAAGADDALAFPIYLPYIQAKALAYRRLADAARTTGYAEPLDMRNGESPHDTLLVGPIRLDRTAHLCFIHNTKVELTPREFGLLEFFLTRADTLCSREQILDHVWGITFDTGTNMVDVYVHFLRRKLEAHGVKGLIETVRGVGYRLVHATA